MTRGDASTTAAAAMRLRLPRPRGLAVSGLPAADGRHPRPRRGSRRHGLDDLLPPRRRAREAWLLSRLSPPRRPPPGSARRHPVGVAAASSVTCALVSLRTGTTST